MIVLLGLLGVIIIPKIGDSITNSKNNAYLVQVESIKKGVNDFLVDNGSMLDSIGTYTMKLGIIKQGGYLPINIKNPKTKKNFSNESVIIINVNENNYDISLNLIDLVDVTESIDSNLPILVLNGNYIEYVEVNSKYQELNAIAKSSDGKNISDISVQIKKDDEEIDNIDTTTLGTYSIVYSATDESGYTTTQTRTVIVRDSTPPTLIVPEDTTLDLIQLSKFDILKGVVVSDNYDSNVDVTVNSNLANIPGNYVVTYTSTDSSGNTAAVRRVISIKGDVYRLEYIKANGNQYIEFDYKAKTNTKVELDIELIKNENTNKHYHVGGVYLESYSNIIGKSFIEDNNFSCNFGAGSNQKDQIYYWVDKPYDNKHAYVQKYSSVTKRSTMIIESGTATFQGVTTSIETKTTNNLSNLVLLGHFSSTENQMVPFKRYDAKVYGFKIYESDELIIDLVPCSTISGVTGLFDLINGKFYPSNGEEDFLRE